MPTEDWQLFRSPSAVACLQQMPILLGDAQRAQLGASKVRNEDMLAEWGISFDECSAVIVVLLKLGYKIVEIKVDPCSGIVRVGIIKLLLCKFVEEECLGCCGTHSSSKCGSAYRAPQASKLNAGATQHG